MEVKVLFFGVLAEVAGSSGQNYGKVKSFNDLCQMIKKDYPEFENYNYRISVNNEIINIDPILKDGDEVALMPPFAGG
jgi:molybdopterin converting factor small subunit